MLGTNRTSVPALGVSAYLVALPFSATPVPWTPLDVTYAGSASWLISGAIQVNIKLPDPLPNDGGYGELLVAVQVGDSLSAPAGVEVVRR
jgi:uncharacterized protein (TIGR03437 family)